MMKTTERPHTLLDNRETVHDLDLPVCGERVIYKGIIVRAKDAFPNNEAVGKLFNENLIFSVGSCSNGHTTYVLPELHMTHEK